VNDQQPFSYFQLFLGLFLGGVVGTVCSMVLYGVLTALLGSGHWAFLVPLLNAVILILLGWIFFKQTEDRGFARGVLISLGFVLILSTTCGIGLLMK
jgi:hypothetical protein